MSETGSEAPRRDHAAFWKAILRHMQPSLSVVYCLASVYQDLFYCKTFLDQDRHTELKPWEATLITILAHHLVSRCQKHSKTALNCFSFPLFFFFCNVLFKSLMEKYFQECVLMTALFNPNLSQWRGPHTQSQLTRNFDKVFTNDTDCPWSLHLSKASPQGFALTGRGE